MCSCYDWWHQIPLRPPGQIAVPAGMRRNGPPCFESRRARIFFSISRMFPPQSDVVANCAFTQSLRRSVAKRSAFTVSGGDYPFPLLNQAAKVADRQPIRGCATLACASTSRTPRACAKSPFVHSALAATTVPATATTRCCCPTRARAGHGALPQRTLRNRAGRSRSYRQFPCTRYAVVRCIT